MSKPVIIIGAGGHGRVLLDSLQLIKTDIIGFTEFDSSLWGKKINGVSIIGDDAWVMKYNPADVLLVNGMGSVGNTCHRQQVYERFLEQGYSFATVVHPSAIVSPQAVIEDGVQVMAGAVINTGAIIGNNSIINTRAAIDHDVIVGKHVHVAPGVTISGGVSIGDGTHIGTGATIIQGIHIGKRAVIGVGSVVLHDIADNVVVYGVPAN